MTDVLPTQTDEWEHSLTATAQETIEHCRSLYDVEQLQPLFQVLPPGSKIIEAGCGLGQYAYMFASLGHHCIGLDYSAKLVEEAASRGQSLPKLDGSTEWIEGNILDLPIESNSVDCYASFGVLEHFVGAQQRQIFAEAHRVLRPGGLHYQFVPNFWSPWTIRREIRYWYRKLRPPGIVWQRNIRRSKLRRLGKNAGFEEICCQSTLATVSLRTMKAPKVIRRLCPAGLRSGCTRMVESMGDWCDKKDILGYGLVYIGKKVE
ncbi:MAG: methyltransferase domain-containing protein [Rubripirellula sp.]